jgi:hypothetical protein
VTALTAVAAVAAAADPLTRESARDAARRELSRPEYAEAQPPLLLRLVGRVLRWFGDLIGDTDRVTRSAGWVELLVALLFVLVVVVVLVRLGPLGAGRRAGTTLFDGDRALTAAQHRAQAEAFAAQGRFAEAVRERLRAAVRELEVRGVLDPRPGRTAGEVARDAGAAAPALADDLRRAAQVFDEVWYGGREAGPHSYATLVEVDDRVRTARTPAAVGPGVPAP